MVVFESCTQNGYCGVRFSDTGIEDDHHGSYYDIMHIAKTMETLDTLDYES